MEGFSVGVRRKGPCCSADRPQETKKVGGLLSEQKRASKTGWRGCEYSGHRVAVTCAEIRKGKDKGGNGVKKRDQEVGVADKDL
eukprot:1753622-Amphidinium_carterae.1